MSYLIKIVTNESDLKQAFEVRRNVFIEEQQVPEEIEMDQYDHSATTQHLIVTDHEGNPVGTARFRPYGEGICKVERVAVLVSQRGAGLGKQIMEKIEMEAKKAGYHTIKLNAQIQAKPFYEKLGYEAYGEIFLDADIEHIAMKKSVRV